jgi:uncharacterized protein (DUF302 family)
MISKLTINLSIMAFILMLSFGLNAQASQEQPQMFLQTESPKSLPETVRVFREEVSAGGWTILNTTNMAGILSAKGHTLAPVLIFDV